MLPQLKEQQHGFVYLINAESTQEYKIGMSKADPLKRVQQLQTAHKNKLILIYVIKSPRYKDIEKVMHNNYNQYNNMLNEWFELSNELVPEVIAKMKMLSLLNNDDFRLQKNILPAFHF